MRALVLMGFLAIPLLPSAAWAGQSLIEQVLAEATAGGITDDWRFLTNYAENAGNGVTNGAITTVQLGESHGVPDQTYATMVLGAMNAGIIEDQIGPNAPPAKLLEFNGASGTVGVNASIYTAGPETPDKLKTSAIGASNAGMVTTTITGDGPGG